MYEQEPGFLKSGSWFWTKKQNQPNLLLPFEVSLVFAQKNGIIFSSKLEIEEGIIYGVGIRKNDTGFQQKRHNETS